MLSLVIALSLQMFPFARADDDASSKVAIIVVSGFEQGNTAVDKTFQQNRQLDEGTYAKAGYKVITLSWDQPYRQPTAENLKSQLSMLKGVKDLQVSFIGHGNITNSDTPPGLGTQPLDPARFPPVKFNSSENPMYNTVSTNKPIQFLMQDDDGNPASYIGIGDIRSSLASVKANNPDSKITVEVMNCFGGNVARDLQDMEGVQVFSGAERSRPGRVLENSGPSADLTGMMMQELAKGHTYNQAFLDAQKRFIEDSLFTDACNPMEAGFPRNQLQEALKSWCDNKAVKTEADSGCKDCNASQAVAHLSDIQKKLAIDMATQDSYAAQREFETAYNKSICKQHTAEATLFLKTAKETTEAFMRNTPLPQKIDFHKLDKLRKAAAKQCSMDSAHLPGEHFIMSLDQIRTAFDSTFTCIQSLNADPIVTYALVSRLNRFVTSFLSENYCIWIQQKIQNYSDDLSCIKQFQTEATDQDWQHVVEIYELGTHSLNDGKEK